MGKRKPRIIEGEQDGGKKDIKKTKPKIRGKKNCFRWLSERKVWTAIILAIILAILCYFAYMYLSDTAHPPKIQARNLHTNYENNSFGEKQISIKYDLINCLNYPVSNVSLENISIYINNKLLGEYSYIFLERKLQSSENTSHNLEITLLNQQQPRHIKITLKTCWERNDKRHRSGIQVLEKDI